MKGKRNTGMVEGGAYPKKLISFVPETPGKEKGNQKEKKIKGECVLHILDEQGRGYK